MNNAVFTFQKPANEPVTTYAPETQERKLLLEELGRQTKMQIEIPLIIGGKEVRTGKTDKIVMPHNHGHVLATYHKAGPKEVEMAIEAALNAHEAWMTLSWIDRASIMLRAAELISKKHRYVLNAATMLGQSKNMMQAEIDSACEVIDFLRFNVAFASEIYGEQPLSDTHTINRMEYRPLEGFVYAIAPFNFTAIAANLNAAPVLMGNVTIWKPATTAILSNYYLMKIFQEAGLPDGVMNFIPGSGAVISEVALNHKDLAGIHFTGSNNTFNGLWRTIADNLPKYKSYPKIVGETGGKDFIFAHKSSKIDELATAIIRGSFEYQGQKCSAASRAYIPNSLWPALKEKLLSMMARVKVGDVTDPSRFVNAVIDEKAFDSIMSYIHKAKESKEAEILWGGTGDKSHGYFIQPTLILTTNPHFLTMEEEIFGPVMTMYVYEDEKYEETLKICDQTSPYGLTGAVFSNDRYAAIQACRALRYAAGNFYFNDKPTGAVVGQQPFGGARGSGTNDKAGGHHNLLRWISPRTVKETLVPATDFEYSYMKN